jgi:twinkle protein
MSKYEGKPMKSNVSLSDVENNGQVVFDIPDRGITADTVMHFGIKKMMNEMNNTVDGYFFPVTKKGKLTGYIKYNPNVGKKNGRFTTVGDVSVESDLLGQSVASKGKKVFIVEGFFDLLSAYQSLDNHKPIGYTANPAVVSPALGIGNISKGVTNSRQHIASNIEFINQYDDKVVCFDNDINQEVNVGQEGVQDLALVLKEFKNCVLPVNDCNDMMLEKGEKELYFALLTAKGFEADNIVQGGIGLDKLCEPIKRGVYIDIFPHAMNILRGFREREMTVVLAPAGVGKTTVCKEIGYALVKKGCKVGHVFLEEDLKKTQQSYIALDNNVHLPKFREDPTIVAQEDIKKSYDSLIDTPNTMWMNHFGSLTPTSLMGKFEWMAIKGMEFIILDHISMVFSGNDNGNERKEIDMLLTEMAAFCVKTGVHCIVVSHIRRMNHQPAKDKSGQVIYPYWDTVDMTQARGSGAFEQLASNVMTVEGQRLEDKSRGNIRIGIEKNRECGVIGKADTLNMSTATGRMYTVELQEEF